MHFPELFRIAFIHQYLVSELFACQVEAAVAHHVIAVKIPSGTGHAVHLAAKDILCKKGCDGALSQSLVFRRPILPHPWRTGIRAPDL